MTKYITTLSKTFLLFFFLFNFSANAATHTVTTNADSGPGSLRQIIANASVNTLNTINFAPNVTHITLTSGPITIAKSTFFLLTINGGNGDTMVTISGNNNSRIFRIWSNSDVSVLSVNNIIFENGYSNYDTFHIPPLAPIITRNFGGAIYISGGGELFAKNCVFKNNHSLGGGGAISVGANSVHAMGLSVIHDCTFYGNTADSGGGAIYTGWSSTFFATNCTFYENESGERGGAIYINAFMNENNTFLYHSTFTKNKAVNAGGAIWIGSLLDTNWKDSGERDEKGDPILVIDTIIARAANLYSYNCLYVGNEVNGIITEENQVENRNQIVADENLFDNSDGLATITKATVFGTNTFTGKHIQPLKLARTAKVLDTNNIVAYVYPFPLPPEYVDPFEWTAPDIIAKLVYDQAKELRLPNKKGKVTYGSVEAIPEFDLTVIAEEGGTVSPKDTNTVDKDSTVIITAIPDNCHNFSEWRDQNNNFISDANPLTVVVTSDTVLIAHFEIKKFNLTVEADENGTVNPVGTSERNCGTSTVLTATADSGYKFLNWTNSNNVVISTQNPRTVVVMSDTLLKANFTEIGDEFFVELRIEPEGAGFGGGGGYFEDGSNITLYAFPANDCYVLKNWTDLEGNIITDEINTANNLLITVISDTVLIANFEKLKFYLSVSAGENGSVDPIPAGKIYECGSTYTIKANPDAGYKFLGWKNSFGGIVSTVNPLDVLIMRDTALIAEFVAEGVDVVFYTLTVISPGVSGGGGTASPSGEIVLVNGTTLTITATPVGCYFFKHWEDENGNVIYEENPLDITVVSDTFLIPVFKLGDFDIIFKQNLAGVVTVDSTVTWKCGTYFLTATEIEDYEFVNWTDAEGKVLSSIVNLALALMSDTVLIRNYKTSSIAENTKISSIKILPNPVYNDAIIEINSLENQFNTVITILDLSGREILTVYSGLLSEGINNFPIPNNYSLANGTYFVSVSNSKGRKVERFVVAR